MTDAEFLADWRDRCAKARCHFVRKIPWLIDYSMNLQQAIERLQKACETRDARRYGATYDSNTTRIFAEVKYLKAKPPTPRHEEPGVSRPC